MAMLRCACNMHHVAYAMRLLEAAAALEPMPLCTSTVHCAVLLGTGTRARRGTQAMVDVAQSYERGLGVGCDVLQAKFWYEKSAQHGSADGAYTVCSRRL
jgi:TPR repeat protein